MSLLRTAIYGLKQSSQAWFEKFSKIVIGSDFQRCVMDHLVFYRTTRGYVILAVYLDDILLTGSDSVGVSETKE